MNKQRALTLMVIVTAAWGASYMWMKVALTETTPLMLVGLRFTIAFVATLVVFPHALRHLTRAQIKAALIMGSLLFALFASVMFGLKQTSATTAGFLISTTAMFVMIFDAGLRRRLPMPGAWLATVAVIVGLFLLVANGSVSWSSGAWFCLLTAALYAVHILYSAHVTQTLSQTFAVSVLQLGVAGGEGLVASLLVEPIALPHTVSVWGAVLALGLVCSAFGFICQTKVQHFLAPATVSMVFSLEPLFSALFGILLLGERLSGLQWLGAAVIFAGVFVHELHQAHR